MPNQVPGPSSASGSPPPPHMRDVSKERNAFAEMLSELGKLHEVELANAVSGLKAENERLLNDQSKLQEDIAMLRNMSSSSDTEKPPLTPILLPDAMPILSDKDKPSSSPVELPGACPSPKLPGACPSPEQPAKIRVASKEGAANGSERIASDKEGTSNLVMKEAWAHSEGSNQQRSNVLEVCLPVMPSSIASSEGQEKIGRSTSAMTGTSSISSRSSSKSTGSPGEDNPRSPDEVRWQWEHRTGWRDYANSAQGRIEQAFQQGHSKVRLQAGKVGATPMEVFFADRVQYDPITKNKRKVQRVGPDPTLTKSKRFLLEVYRSWESGRPWRETVDHYQSCRDQLLNSRSQNAVDDAAITRSSTMKNVMANNIFSTIVQSSWFFTISMMLVVLNAVWMAIETDANDMDVLSQAPVGFQIVEHAFCTLFLLELMIRLFAFQRMTECIYDAWFRFDFVLVSLLVVETWLVPLGSMLASADEESHNKLSIFRLLRLLRLSRVTKLLHAAPEIAVLIKGMLAASRSVLVTMLLLVFLLCVFGLVCRTQAKSDQYLEDLYFGSVGQSMWTLFLHGTLLDSVSVPMNILKERNVGMCIIFTVFVFLSNLTVMNMLIGILCDVVARVKVEETDRDERHQLRSALSKMLECYDFNHNGLLEEKEFVLLMENPDIIEILKKFGTDVGGLLTLSSIVFADCTGLSKAGSLSFDEFLDLAARLKGDHSARVTDVVEQREYTRQRLDQLETEVLQCQQELKEGVECIIASLPKGSKMKTIR